MIGTTRRESPERSTDERPAPRAVAYFATVAAALLLGSGFATAQLAGEDALEAEIATLTHAFEAKAKSWKEQARASYEADLDVLKREYYAERDEIKADYAAKLEDWKARCLAVAAGDDLGEPTCFEARKDIRDEAREALDRIRAEAVEKKRDLDSSHRAKLHEYLREARRELDRSVQALRDAAREDDFERIFEEAPDFSSDSRELNAPVDGPHVRPSHDDAPSCTPEGLCRPPANCVGRLYQTPDCTPPEFCTEVETGVFMCDTSAMRAEEERERKIHEERQAREREAYDKRMREEEAHRRHAEEERRRVQMEEMRNFYEAQRVAHLQATLPSGCFVRTDGGWSCNSVIAPPVPPTYFPPYPAPPMPSRAVDGNWTPPGGVVTDVAPLATHVLSVGDASGTVEVASVVETPATIAAPVADALTATETATAPTETVTDGSEVASTVVITGETTTTEPATNS